MKKHLLLQERLRREMARKQLSAMELARLSGVKNSFIYDILNGKSLNPSGVRLATVAEVLKVSLNYLLAGTDDTPAGYIAVARLSAGKSARHGEDAPYYFQQSWIEEVLGASPQSLRLLMMMDDSMSPTLQKGDALLVDTSRNAPNPAGIFVLSDEEGLLVKRVERAADGRKTQLHVLSDNPRYGAHKHAVRDIRILGRVIWFARGL